MAKPSNVESSLAYMGAEEFMNTFLMMWSFDESKDILKKYLPLPDDMNPFLKEGIESAEQLVMTAGIFKMMQQSEKFLQFLFEMGRAILLLMLGLAKKGYNKLKNHVAKGRRFKAIAGFLAPMLDDAIEKAKIFVDWIRNIILGRSSHSDTAIQIDSASSIRSNVISKDQSAMQMGQNMAKNTIDTLMVKILTKTFNESDKVVLKKILGRETVGDLDVADMNRIANALYVTDSNNKSFGLPEQIASLLNGLGYVHKSSSVVTP